MRWRRSVPGRWGRWSPGAGRSRFGCMCTGCRGWLVVRAGAVAGASGGQADLCRDGAAGVAAGRGAGQRRAGVADRAGADPPVGVGPRPGLPLSRLRGAVASGGPSRGPLGRRRPDGSGNLAGLCPFHHDAHHRGEFSIGGDANTCGGLVFLARGGFAIGPGPIYAPTPHPETGRRPGSTRVCDDRVSTGPARTVWISAQRPGRPGRPEPGLDCGDLGGPRRPRRGHRPRAGRSGRAVARSRTAGGLPGRDRRGAAQQVGHLPRRPSPPALNADRNVSGLAPDVSGMEHVPRGEPPFGSRPEAATARPR